MSDDLTKDDQLVTVQMPARDYIVLREIIAERQAVTGFMKLLNKVALVAGGLLTFFGLVEILRRYWN